MEPTAEQCEKAIGIILEGLPKGWRWVGRLDTPSPEEYGWWPETEPPWPGCESDGDAVFIVEKITKEPSDGTNT